jgi:hypothetical protein
MNDAEIAGYMNWRGPGAYTERQLQRIRLIVEEVTRREREACLNCYSPDDTATDWADKIRARGGNAT